MCNWCKQPVPNAPVGEFVLHRECRRQSNRAVKEIDDLAEQYRRPKARVLNMRGM